LQQNKYTATTALAVRGQIIGGGAPINKVGGGTDKLSAAAARRGRRMALEGVYSIITRIMI